MHRVSALTKRPVILHLDINRTILQIDAAGGKTLQDVLNTNVAGRVFGRAAPSRSTVFELVETRFDRSDGPLDDQSLMSYDEFVDKIVAAPVEMASASAEERRSIWKRVSESRRAMLHSFTHPGEPGEAFHGHIVIQEEALRFTNERRRLIPSFFRLVNELSKFEWPFVVVFRTFGNDLDEVLKEWTSFVMGTHHFQPEGPLLEAMRHGPQSPVCGALFRNELGMSVSWNRHAPVPPPPAGVDSTTLAPEVYLRQVVATSGCEAHAVSYHQLFNEIVEKAQKGGGVLGLVDYYYYWSQHAESRSAGKVFPVLTPQCGSGSEGEALPPYQVFFDDNIFVGDEKSIVDMRCAETGQPLDLSDESAYCCGVAPYLAVVFEDYFVNELAERMLLQDRLLRRLRGAL